MMALASAGCRFPPRTSFSLCHRLWTSLGVSTVTSSVLKTDSLFGGAIHRRITCRYYWTPYKTSHATHVRSLTSQAPRRETEEDFQLVYTGPLKGAVKALKIFSLTTAVLASFGGPVLVWLGKESVPVAARLAISSIVLLVGLSTTAILHWLLKGYIIQLYYHPSSQRVAATTFSLLARKVRNEFATHEMLPPSGLAGFSTFQARGKSYFMHTEVFPDRALLMTFLNSQQTTQKENGHKNTVKSQ